ncbi:MAG TPA: phosphoribosylanthranilate isomerase [Candidatus Sulfotelmatobacter sp.]|jgi:phosphoribosylanthranilate isomerase|nr:phosphoribosylanthranilate isomerase [Candidatus Sulfotelmatobacter sp.]
MSVKPVKVKICGLTDEETVDAAIDAGADFVGVVFFDKSPRGVTIERANELLEFVPEEVQRVGLFVDPSNEFLDQIMNNLRLDLFQFHGSETPERIDEVHMEYGMPVMKALGVSSAADLDAAQTYAEVCDWLLFDAKAPAGADRPGGNAAAFDWSLLAGRKWACPWMLAGGLHAGNVAEAVRLSGARAVDVSSGVESAPGVKDAEKIAAFIRAAKGA